MVVIYSLQVIYKMGMIMGWVATVFLVFGRYYIGNMASQGLLFSFFGDFLWFVVGTRKKIPSLAVAAAIMTVWDVIGWFKWEGYF